MAESQQGFAKIMMSKTISAGVCALALCVGAPALAGVSQDFSECDGLKKPKSSDDGMRGEATFPAYLFGGPSASAPQATLAACDRALGGKNLRPEQTLRRAHLLRARAAAKIELGDSAGALADLDAAQLAAADYRGEFFYDRSMGLSMDLLRALALSQSGQQEAALLLAEQAAIRRPYALELQRVAVLLHSVTGDQPSDRALWQGLSRIDPMVRGLSERMVGTPQNFDDLADDAEPPRLVLPPLPRMQDVLGRGGDITRNAEEWQGAVNRALVRAYAHAAKGHPDQARAWIEATRETLDRAEAQQTSAAPDTEPLADAGLGAIFARMARSNHLVPMTQLVEARIAVAEGRLGDAAAAFAEQPLRSTPVTEEFHAAYAAARGTREDVPALPPLVSTPKRGTERLAKLARTLLIRPESQRKLIDYEQSRPNILGALVGAAFSLGTSLLGGIERSAGFRSTPQSDGTIMVEFTGNTTSAPMVQEMTLLRAAEIARESGKSHFHIASRRDFERMLTQSMNGVPMQRTLVGYKTELTIRLIDDPAGEPDALDAVDVIDSLGPVYYGA